MQLIEAEQLALSLMEEFGLQHWEFTWTRSKTLMGQCTRPRFARYGTISLSRHYVQLNDRDHVEDTIRHEIAHALVGPEKGHGPEWVEACKRTGASPIRIREAIMPPGRWTTRCGRCGVDFSRHRAPRTRGGWHCCDCYFPLPDWEVNTSGTTR